MYSPEMKFVERVRTTKGHGSIPFSIDTEPRKHRYQSGLETLVVYAVNAGCWARLSWPSLTQNTPPGEKLQGRGLNEIGGSLYKRWSMWFNSTVLGKPYQSVFALYLYFYVIE